MSRSFLLIVVFYSFLSNCAAQTPNQNLNLDFEKTDASGRVTGCRFSWDQNGYFTHKDGLVKKNGNYSLRLEKDLDGSKAGFGTITFSIPANFKGKKLTLKGYIKSDSVQDGFAGLWLRADAGTETVGFDNMQDRGVTGTRDWRQYTVTASINDEVTDITFGGLLVGRGRTWFDQLELLVDDKPIQSITWIPNKTRPKRIEMTASGVTIDSLLTGQQIKNLYVLGKTWGFLKYHHPAVAAGTYDFDSSLFSVMPNVLRAKTDGERDDILLSWIGTLGNVDEKSRLAAVDTSAIHSRPNLGWLEDKDLVSAEVSARLKNIYDHRNTKSNYYIRLAPGVGNPNFDKEAVYTGVPSTDDGFRMLALFRYWNIIEYFFPYKHILKERWSEVLEEFVPVFASNRSALHYRLACLRLINRVHDTHANIYGDPLLSAHFGTKMPAFDFKLLEGKVIVNGFLSDSLARFQTLKPGDEIIDIGGKTIEERRKLAEPYLCASNPSVADRNFLDRFLFKSNDDSLMITYKRNGSLEKTFLRFYPAQYVPYQNGDNWRMPMYKFLSDDIGYISLGKIKADSLPVIFNTFKNTKGIVIDIRNYPTEFMPFAMGEYLKSSATPFVKFTTGNINNPGSFSFTKQISNGPEKNSRVKKYNGAVVILINEQSQSQAEYTAMALRTADRATVIGSQTAGADGNISYVPFPGGFYSPFSGIGVFYPDGKETQGVGIIPDVRIVPTQKGIAEGRDEVLETAVDHIRKMKGF